MRTVAQGTALCSAIAVAAAYVFDRYAEQAVRPHAMLAGPELESLECRSVDTEELAVHDPNDDPAESCL